MNHAPLKELVEDLISFIDGHKLCMMTTRQKESGYLVSRCMELAAREDSIDLLFHTNTVSGKTDELVGDPHVNVGFLNSSKVSSPRMKKKYSLRISLINK